ncbi:unnamed protein product [Nezara viridula]|uniref:Uncharacterized protein n=1 Tax=Nezara viridula TaxID=85310 RepID=A0A9P0E5K1_NEZVI|nr:unnamed protein product [Nezara viridula]
MAGRGRMSNGFNNYDKDDYQTEMNSQDGGSQMKQNQRRESGQPTLHVANIPQGLDEKGLSNIFAAECSVPVRVYISKNKKGQQSNTYWGFVEYKTVAEAQSAISAVHKKPPYELFVQFSKAYQDSSREKSEKYTGNMGPTRGQGQFPPSKERNNYRTSRSNDESFNEDFVEDNNSYSFSSPVEKNTSSPAEKLTGLPIEKYTHVEITDEMDLHVAAYMSSRAKDLTLNDLSDLCSEIKLALPFKPGQCSYCFRTAIYTCSRCKTWYCSDFCRATHWPQHKDKCSPRSVIFEKDGTLTYKDVSDAFCNEQPVMQKNIGMKSPRDFQGKNYNLDYQNDGFNNYDNGFERNNPRVNEKFSRDNIENGNRSPDNRLGRENHSASDQGNRGYQRNSHRGGAGGGDRRGGGRQFGGRPDRNTHNHRSRNNNESDSYNSVEPFNGPDPDKPQSHKSSNLSQAPIPPNTFTKVTVGAVKRDNEFWAYKLDDYQKQGSMMTELKKCVLEGDHADIRIETGSKCIAPYEGDWYRAEIVQIFRDNVKVVFIDFGNESEVKKCDLKSLPEYIASEPPMAHRFVLANSPDNQKLHEELTFSIKPVMQDKSGRWLVHAEGVNYPPTNGFED